MFWPGHKTKKEGDSCKVVAVEDIEEKEVRTQKNDLKRMYTKDDLQAALLLKCTQDEWLYTQIDIKIAEDPGILKNDYIAFGPKAMPKIAFWDNLIHHLELEKTVLAITKNSNANHNRGEMEGKAHEACITQCSAATIEEPMSFALEVVNTDSEWVSALNEEQKRAHDIILSCLHSSL